MRLALLLTPSGPRCPTLAIASVGTGVPGATEGKPSGVTGTGLAWRRTGSGEPLLLLHGLGSTQDDFAALRPALEATYDVLAVDLPGLGVSAPTSRTPTVAALADDLEADLDLVHPDRLHILGTSLGARLALELAKRGRALSVVAVAPSGLNAPPERIYQGSVMATTRMLTRLARPVLDGMVTNRAGRAALLMHLRARPWQATEEEGRAVARGFADSADFWRVLWWSVLADLPTGLDRIDCPVLLRAGNPRLDRRRADAPVPSRRSRITVRVRPLRRSRLAVGPAPGPPAAGPGGGPPGEGAAPGGPTDLGNRPPRGCVDALRAGASSSWQGCVGCAAGRRG